MPNQAFPSPNISSKMASRHFSVSFLESFSSGISTPGRRMAQAAKTGPAGKTAPQAASQEADGSLLAALKALRFRLAQEAGVPAYVVFSNAALTDMAALRPLNMEEFLQVSGVGRVKAERYGEVFLKVIRDWRAGVGE